MYRYLGKKWLFSLWPSPSPWRSFNWNACSFIWGRSILAESRPHDPRYPCTQCPALFTFHDGWWQPNGPIWPFMCKLQHWLEWPAKDLWPKCAYENLQDRQNKFEAFYRKVGSDEDAWAKIGATKEIDFSNDYFYVGIAVSADTNGKTATISGSGFTISGDMFSFPSVAPSVSSAPSTYIMSQDIGNVGKAGSATMSGNGKVTVIGSGWGKSEQEMHLRLFCQIVISSLTFQCCRCLGHKWFFSLRQEICKWWCISWNACRFLRSWKLLGCRGSHEWVKIMLTLVGVLGMHDFAKH